MTVHLQDAVRIRNTCWFECRTATKLLLVLLFVLPVLSYSNSTKAAATVYYVSNDGSDNNDGKSPEAPWRTIDRVNAEPFMPGDVILFRRSDYWREHLVPRSGNETGYITYGAYGSGDKPLLLGSVEKNNPDDWVYEGGNIWATIEPTASGNELLANPSFSRDDSDWYLYNGEAARVESSRDTSDYDSAPAGYRLRCIKAGKGISDIKLCTNQFSVKRGGLYLFVFRAKCTTPFMLGPPRLTGSGSAGRNYSLGPEIGKKRVEKTWTTYMQFYRAKVTAGDARLTFYLGGGSNDIIPESIAHGRGPSISGIPEGATFYLDSLSFAEYTGDNVLTNDVGNIIFDGEASCGVKVWNQSDLNAQGKYWYDEQKHVLKLYSSKSPSIAYLDVECALRDHIIDQSNTSYVVYDNLALKYGGAHGIGGANTHHIIVRNCDVSYIGGGNIFGGRQTVRYGNGIEFWANAHDNLVEKCRLWEIYDAALTNQATGPGVKQYNIYYRNNIIWNCEYSFEYWNQNARSQTHHIYFENNTCAYAGYGWGNSQRPDPTGRHLCFYTSSAPAKDFYIRNNIFFETKRGNAFYASAWPEKAITALRMDNNCWYQSEGVMIRFKDSSYTMARFPAYQSEKGKEANSITELPRWVDAANGDFHLTEQSGCIDAGSDIGLTEDYEGNPIPNGTAPDIGAYEFPIRLYP